MNTCCLLCGTTTEIVADEIFDTRFGIHASYSIVKCSSCGLEQTNPIPDQTTMNMLYEKFYNFSGEINTRYTKLRSSFINSFFYRIWLFFDGDISFHQRNGSGALIDIGCNEGRGLEFYKKHGFDAEGLELNSIAAGVAREKGFVVFSNTVEDFDTEKKYDVVVLSNVLEHSLNPAGMLARLNDLLEPRGQIWISCPNSKSFFRYIFGAYWINWHVPFHVTHFNAATLRKLLEDNQFEIDFIWQETPALWVAHSLIATFFSKKNQPTNQLRSSFLVIFLIMFIRGLLFPFLWILNLFSRGDCLIVIARKK